MCSSDLLCLFERKFEVLLDKVVEMISVYIDPVKIIIRELVENLGRGSALDFDAPRVNIGLKALADGLVAMIHSGLPIDGLAAIP